MILESPFFHSKKEFSGSKNKKEEKNIRNCLSFVIVHIFLKVPVTVIKLSFFKLKFPVVTNKHRSICCIIVVQSKY